ncbi:hypothetical protein AKO1_014699 [Acrasis kona]|uniref:MYND-type domain-containing protein n=1 Tax=Acrasis kona TaxID=1008807 RepID=A0AAW2Z1Y0_9EUKA
MSNNDWKEQGNTLFRNKEFEKAKECYQKAVVDESISNDKRAVLYSNLSLCEQKLQRMDEAIEYANKSIQADPSYLKGHSHKVISLLSQQKTDDACECITSLMKQGKKSAEFTQTVQDLQKRSSYFTQQSVIESLTLYPSLRFPQKVVIVDPNGAGHFTTVTDAVAKSKRNASIIVRPAIYKNSAFVIESEVEMIGDGDREDIVIENTQFNPLVLAYHGGCHFYAKNLTFVQKVKGNTSPHAVIMEGGSSVSMENVVLNAPDVATLSVARSCNLNLKSCVMSKAHGAIVSDGGKIEMVDCEVKDIVRIGVEIRQDASAVLTNCKIYDCGMSGVTSHAGASSLVMNKCEVFRCYKLSKEAANFFAAGTAFVENCHFHHNHGGCIVLDCCNAVLEGNRINDCLFGVGFSANGGGLLKRNTIERNSIGLNIAFNGKGVIRLEDNIMSDNKANITTGPNDKKPIIISGPDHVTEISEEEIQPALAIGQTLNQKERKIETKQWRKNHAENPFSVDAISKHSVFCSFCSAFEPPNAEKKFQRCSRCKGVYYCSADCQKRHWTSHKPVCMPPKTNSCYCGSGKEWSKCCGSKDSKKGTSYVNVTGVKTHHFFIILGENVLDRNKFVKDKQNRILVWVDRNKAMNEAKKKKGNVVGMGDQKWEIFQRVEDFVIVE